MNITWTAEETNFLKDNLHKLTILEISEALNKTQKSIRRKLDREGLKKGDYQKWTTEDDRILLENKDKKLREVLQVFAHKNRNTVIKKFYNVKK